MFKTRTISGIIMCLIILPILYFGGYALNIATLIIALLGYKELLDIKKDYHIPIAMKIIGAILMSLLIFLNITRIGLVLTLSYSLLGIIFLILVGPTVFYKMGTYKVNEAFYLYVITLFMGIVFNIFLNLYNESIIYLIYVILIACVTDIFAFTGGSLIGKHKFTKISPNKTIEGCLIGSFVGTIVASTYFITLNGNVNSVLVFLITFILTIVGQIGDLFFSLIKRENDVKDFSNLIPGHGGILDRIDSIIFILITLVFILKFI